jgi:hypothetical protein
MPATGKPMVVKPSFPAKDTSSTVVIMDTVKRAPNLFERKHKPTTAALLSMALPGLGQVYNGKHWYWKVPIIYGGFAGLGYAIAVNAKNHKQFSNAYRLVVNSDSINSFVIDGSTYTEANLLDFKNYYKRNLDISAILTAVLYVLNIVDAAVYAHLFYFDKEMNQKLSLHIEPAYEFRSQGESYIGMKINLRL